MSDADVNLAQISAHHHGVVDARASGLSRRQLADRRASGLLIPALPGVDVHAAAPSTWLGSVVAAAVAAGHDAVVSHRSAARLHDLRDVPVAAPELTVLGTTRRRHPGVITHRSDTLDTPDRCRVGGVPTTSVARTLLDLGAVVHSRVVELAAQDAVIRHLVTIEDLLCVLDRLGVRGRRGVRALREAVLAELPPAEVESRLEAELLRLIRRAGVPEPVVQYETVVGGGLRVRFDMAWPDLRVAVEADGRRWHATRQSFERDLFRARAITAAAWKHYRYGWPDVRERPEATITEVRSAIASASAA